MFSQIDGGCLTTHPQNLLSHPKVEQIEQTMKGRNLAAPSGAPVSTAAIGLLSGTVATVLNT